VLSVPTVSSAAADGPFLALTTSDGLSANVFEHNLLYASIDQYRSDPVCCAVSGEFHVVVAGLKDGGILIADLMTRVISHVIDLPGAFPLKLLITESFGFVVSFAQAKGQNWIFVHAVNGAFVRKLAVAAPVSV
jgi:hypothetical protein